MADLDQVTQEEVMLEMSPEGGEKGRCGVGLFLEEQTVLSPQQSRG